MKPGEHQKALNGELDVKEYFEIFQQRLKGIHLMCRFETILILERLRLLMLTGKAGLDADLVQLEVNPT
jgi:hypothetical protein